MGGTPSVVGRYHLGLDFIALYLKTGHKGDGLWTCIGVFAAKGGASPMLKTPQGSLSEPDLRPDPVLSQVSWPGVQIPTLQHLLHQPPASGGWRPVPNPDMPPPWTVRSSALSSQESKPVVLSILVDCCHTRHLLFELLHTFASLLSTHTPASPSQPPTQGH